MTQVAAFPIDQHVSVLPHAVGQARARFGAALGENLSDYDVGQMIAREVRAAVEAGLVYDGKPRAFRFYAERGLPMPPWQRFVLVPSDQSRGYVVALDFPPDVTVVTTLSRPQKIVRR